MKSIQSSRYEQLSLFSEKELQKITPKKQPKKLFVLIEAPDGHSWWQEVERVKGEKPWQTCMRYKRESLGRGYWVCTYELR